MVCNEIATRDARPGVLRPLPTFVKTSLLVSPPHARRNSFSTTPSVGIRPCSELRRDDHSAVSNDAVSHAVPRLHLIQHGSRLHVIRSGLLHHRFVERLVECVSLRVNSFDPDTCERILKLPVHHTDAPPERLVGGFGILCLFQLFGRIHRSLHIVENVEHGFDDIDLAGFVPASGLAIHSPAVVFEFSSLSEVLLVDLVELILHRRQPFT